MSSPSVFHNRTVLSSLPLAMRRPSGLNATLDTLLSWRIGWPMSSPSVFHNRTVLSSLPLAMRVPSGLNATLVTLLSWRIGWPMSSPVGVPQPHGVVIAATGNAGAVGAERHALSHRWEVDDFENISLLIQRREQLIVSGLLRRPNGVCCQQHMHQFYVMAAERR